MLCSWVNSTVDELVISLMVRDYYEPYDLSHPHDYILHLQHLITFPSTQSTAHHHLHQATNIIQTPPALPSIACSAGTVVKRSNSR